MRVLVAKKTPPQKAPYPVIISQLFVSRNVPIEGSQVLYTTDRNVVGLTMMHMMELLKIEDTWCRNPSTPGFHPNARNHVLLDSYVVPAQDDGLSDGESKQYAASRHSGWLRRGGRAKPDVWAATDSIWVGMEEIRDDVRFLRDMYSRG